MTLRGAILTGVTVAALLASGGVLASAINDLPQDAVPIQDPTAALNRQTPVQALPIEPAPEAAPAPASPIAVTPVTPPIVVADVEGQEDEEAEAEEAPVKRVEAPAAPARRQRRRVAIVEAIDKITAESMRFEVEVGGVRSGSSAR